MSNVTKTYPKHNRPHIIAFIGECMVEISGTLPSPLQLSFAGDTFNTAAYLARLMDRQGDRIEYLTGLGADMLSLSMRSFLESCKVGTGYIRTIENRAPGLYLIEIAEGGERLFHYWRGEAAAKFFLDDVSTDDLVNELLNFTDIYISGISIAVLSDIGKAVLYDALTEAKQRGLKIYFDSNYRPALWPNRNAAQVAFEKFLLLADIAMLTDTDLMQLYDVSQIEVRPLVKAFDVPEIVLKCGANPCLIYQNGDCLTVPACKVPNVIDTTAAGDSFNAAYLAARLKGLPVKKGAEWGHLLASHVIQQHGAMIDKRHMPKLTSAEPNCCSNR
jgi:2-dehydro-3-deoxygluconokinase